jgi:hypothetical protein
MAMINNPPGNQTKTKTPKLEQTKASFECNLGETASLRRSLHKDFSFVEWNLNLATQPAKGTV